MENRKCVFVPKLLHKEIKRRATERETTIEKIIKEILNKEFDQNGQ
ncbi:MAG: hypothetical protein ACTSQJ_01770 [Promethearchaeota archaeon]|jgi:hypothetical protein